MYMTDAVQMCCKNIAEAIGGSYPTKRWSEILNPPPTETKSCEEITADIVKRCGLEVRN